MSSYKEVLNLRDDAAALARLRAAAPDLLAACERAAHEINRADGDIGSAMATLKLLRKVIAKATEGKP